MSYLVSLGFLAILACLAAALFFMLRGGEGGSAKSRRMARALGARVGIFYSPVFCCHGKRAGYSLPAFLRALRRKACV